MRFQQEFCLQFYLGVRVFQFKQIEEYKYRRISERKRFLYIYL